MPAPKPIQIIGGGLAGLTLGIALRRQEIPVTILEAGRYPRHRVCGEFISGLRQLLEEAGAVDARTVAFHSATKSSSVQRLPSAAGRPDHGWLRRDGKPSLHPRPALQSIAIPAAARPAILKRVAVGYRP